MTGQVAAVAFFAVAAVCSSASAGVVYEEDFSVTNAAGKPYGIFVDRISHYSHGHGRTIGGRYAILVPGAKHRLALADVGDFALTAKVSLETMQAKDVPLGLRLYFHYDRATKKGDAVELFRAPGGLVTLVANGKEYVRKTNVPRAALLNLPLTLTVKGTRATFELGAFKATFPCRTGAGAIAFDSSDSVIEQLYLDDVRVESDEKPAWQSERTLAFELPAVQGFQLPLKYAVTVRRGKGGYAEIACELSGGAASCETNKPGWSCGGEWCAFLEKLETPYVRYEDAEGCGETLQLWNGERMFFDTRHKSDQWQLPCAWPLKCVFRVENLPANPVWAAGYRHAIADPWRFAETGGYEQIRDEKGAELYLGEAMTGGRIVTRITSPADKKIVSKIPADLPRRDEALRYAREQHTFYESETVRFTLESFFRANEREAAEVRDVPRFTDVYGAPLSENVELRMKNEECRNGICCVTREVALKKNPGCGVYKLVLGDRTEIFEVLSDNPNGPCPPLASGLPYFVSMPNETRFNEQNAFDPWGAFGGVGHYFACDNRYPRVGDALQVWKLAALYRRQWWCWNWFRNSDDCDMYGDWNKSLIRHADIFGGFDNARQKQARYELGVISYYVDAQLKMLRDFVRERRPPLKRLTLARLDELVAANKPISFEDLRDIFETCWNDWKAYARPRIEANEQAFTDYLLSVNPKVGFANYGPYAFYVSHYKSAYALTYCGYPVERDPRVRENGSFWIFEEYHHSCDYPMFRAAYFVATYDLHYGYGRRIFPEIYYSGWTFCGDGAVYQAHPLEKTTLADTHQRRVAYTYAYGTPHFKDGQYGFWKDYGFHAREPERSAMEQFVLAWGDVHHNPPKRAPKAAFVLVDFDAIARHGEFFDDKTNPVLEGEQFADICNTAEDDLAYAYERAVRTGYTTPVVATLKELDALTPEIAEFVVLPPLVKGTPQATVDAVRRLHARGVPMIGFESAVGLEDLFDTTSSEIAACRTTPTGRTAFVKDPPSLADRASFRDVYHWGQDSLSVPVAKAVDAAIAFLAPQPAVKAERALAQAAWSEKGDLTVVVSDESPIYGDTAFYPVQARLDLRLPGIGAATVETREAYSVIRRARDRLSLRIPLAKDTALFFKFTFNNK